MKNLDLLPASKEIQKDLWRDSLLLDGQTGIEMGYVGNMDGVHQFQIEYREGYRGFNFTDDEIKEKAHDVISILPDTLDIDFGIVRRFGL